MRELKVEIADTPIKRARGLMGRKHMDHDSGMLFKFPSHQELKFWMKNTYLPLHIAFVEDDGTIAQIEEMVPLCTKAVVASKLYKFALEVNYGWFEKNQVMVGSKIRDLYSKM